MIVLGALLLVAAGAVALGGILANTGSDHVLAQAFTIFGYEVESSTGRLFLYGIVVGAVAALGFGLMVAGVNRGVRSRVATRRELRRTQAEKEALQRQHDELASQLDRDHTVERHDVERGRTSEPHHTNT